MKKYKGFILLLFLLGLISLISNYKIYKSHVLQYSVLNDFNSQTYKSENFVKLENSDISYPNIGVTVIPSHMMLAKYYIIFKDYYKALDILKKYDDKKSNPYLSFEESLKSEIFLKLGIRDSVFNYAKIAYENLPGNALYFQNYLRELTHKKDIDEIKKIMRENNFKYNDPQFFENYFASLIYIMDKEDKEIINYAKEAIKTFPGNNKLKIISSYIIYGQDNFNKAYQLSVQGQIEFEENKNFEEAAKNYSEAYTLYPLDYTFPENAGMSYLSNKEYKKAIEYFEFALKDKFNKSGKSEFGIGTSYEQLGEINKACEFYNKAIEYNYKPAFRSHSKLCFK